MPGPPGALPVAPRTAGNAPQAILDHEGGTQTIPIRSPGRRGLPGPPGRSELCLHRLPATWEVTISEEPGSSGWVRHRWAILPASRRKRRPLDRPGSPRTPPRPRDRLGVVSVPPVRPRMVSRGPRGHWGCPRGPGHRIYKSRTHQKKAFLYIFSH